MDQSKLEQFYDAHQEYVTYYQNLLEEINEKILEANPEIAELVVAFNDELRPKQEEIDLLFLKMNKLMMELNTVSEEFALKSKEAEEVKNKLLDSDKYNILREVEEVVFAQLDQILDDPEHGYHELYKQEQQLIEEQDS